MKFYPTEKQSQFCDVLARSDDVHFLLQGAQGSGKTSIGVRGWASWLATECPPGHRHICTYADDRQGKVELGGMLTDWSKETGLRVRLLANRWFIESMHGSDQVVLPMPYGRALADPKFLNWNLASCFVDEAVNMPAGSRKHLISRLRAIDNPKAIWCYNPIDKNEFKQEVHDPIEAEAMGGHIWVFTASDNPSLPVGYRQMQEWNYPSQAERTRMIEGMWAAMEGLVYPERFTAWSEISPHGRVRPKPEGAPDWFAAGVDPDDGAGTTAAVLLAKYKTGVWVVGEWGNRQAERKMDAIERAQKVHTVFTKNRSVRLWVVDVAGGDMIPELARLAYGSVTTSGRPPLPVVQSINHVRRFFNNEWLWIDPACTELINEGSKYHYAEGAPDRYGDNKPVKENDHYVDALRYVLSQTTPLETVREPVRMVPAPARRIR